MKQFDDNLSRERVTAADYSVEVHNLGKFTTMVDIYRFFRDTHGVKVTEVSRVSHAHERVKFEEKITDFQKKLYVTESRLSNLPAKFESKYKSDLVTQVNSLKHSVQHYEMLKAINDDPRLQGNTFIGIAFVSFETVEMKKMILEHYRKNPIIEWCSWSFDTLFGWLIEILCTGDKVNSKPFLTYRLLGNLS